MSDTNRPDFTNTPASDQRPAYHYQPLEYDVPVVSIITPYYNTTDVFWETVRSIQRMSFTQWEWIIVDDESVDPESVNQLQILQAMDSRVRVLRQKNAGPAVARNRAASEARGHYLFQLDSDDLIEPTFVEKAVWFLETQPQFAACNSRTVTFGSKNFLWPHGFEEHERCLKENWVTNQAVIRRDAFFDAGGYDETISYEHADWDFWLNLAEVGHWGHTLPEYLTWYRTQENSLMVEILSDRGRDRRFRTWLHSKHQELAGRFPRPKLMSSVEIPYSPIREDIPFDNSLVKPDWTARVLMIVPWLSVGGADKVNLDLIELLSARGYQFTVATTLRSDHPWLSRFAALTPDIFCLDRFLNYGDYPRFLRYLIESRDIDAVLVSNSELGYSLTPYLRAHYPQLAILDYSHSEVESWKDGGYPGMAVRLGRQLDLNVTSTRYLRDWMVQRGADADRIDVCHCGIDTKLWSKETVDLAEVRSRHALAADEPLLLFVGRFSQEKRPLLFAQIVKRVLASGMHCQALMVGAGDELDKVADYVRTNGLKGHVRLIGAQPAERVRDLLAAADILVLPSEIEGLAMVLFEAMAMETVPVAADIGGQRELVTPETGFLVPPGPHELDHYVKAVSQLLSDPAQRERMARRGHQLVIDHFDLANMAEDMDAAITHARQLAATRPADVADLASAQHGAFLAIDYMRLEELANERWAERNRSASWGRLRRMREAVLPIGSGRYEVYKGVRQAIRRWKGRLARRAGRLRRPSGGVRPMSSSSDEGAEPRKGAQEISPVSRAG